MAEEKWFEGEVTRIVDATSNTKQFFFKLPHTNDFQFKPGQFITMDLPIHEKKNKRWRSYSVASHPNGTNEFELVMLDNEVAHCAVEKSQISSEEELDAVLNIDVADDVADDLVNDAVEVELPNQDTNLEVEVDEDIIEDVDLELEPVDFEDEVGDVAEIPDDEVQEITDVNDETDYEQDTSVISGFPDILADDNGTAMNFGNIKDLLSMLFTMSMATDSESIINTNGESYADTYADTYGDTTTNYPSASDPDELD